MNHPNNFIPITLLLCLALVAPALAKVSVPSALPVAVAARLDGAIHIDGKLDEPAWHRVKGYEIHYVIGKHSQARQAQQTQFKVVYDNQALYLAVFCQQRSLKKQSNQATQRDGPVWTNDDVEIFLSPGGHFSYQFAVNRIGTRYDSQLASLKKYKKEAQGSGWDGVWQAATRRTTKGWTAEVRIPFATLGLSPKTPSTWRMNIGRTIGHSKTYISWSPVQNGFSDLPRFGTLKNIQADFSRFVIDAAALKFPPLLLGDNKVTLSLPVSHSGWFWIYQSRQAWKPGTQLQHYLNTQKIQSEKGHVKFTLQIPVQKSEQRQCLTLAIANGVTGWPILLRSHLFKAPAVLKAALAHMVYGTQEKNIQLMVIIATAPTSAHGKLVISLLKGTRRVGHAVFPVNGAGVQHLCVPIAGLSEGHYKLNITAHLKNLPPVTRHLSFFILPGPFAGKK